MANRSELGNKYIHNFNWLNAVLSIAKPRTPRKVTVVSTAQYCGSEPFLTGSETFLLAGSGYYSSKVWIRTEYFRPLIFPSNFFTENLINFLKCFFLLTVFLVMANISWEITRSYIRSNTSLTTLYTFIIPYSAVVGASSKSSHQLWAQLDLLALGQAGEGGDDNQAFGRITGGMITQSFGRITGEMITNHLVE